MCLKATKDGLTGIYIREAQYQHQGTYTCEALTPLHADTKAALISVNGDSSLMGLILRILYQRLEKHVHVLNILTF